VSAEAVRVEEVGNDRAGGRRREEGFACGHGTDPGEEFFHAGVLAKEPAGPGMQSPSDVLIRFEGGADEDPGLGQRRVAADRGRRGQAVRAGHANVHEDDVGVVDAGELHGFLPVAGFTDDLRVVAGVDQRPEGGSYQGLVVGEQDAEAAPGKRCSARS
jgi:hypothetical protein